MKLFIRLISLFCFFTATVLLGSCGVSKQRHQNKMIVSVKDQQMLLLSDNKPVKSYKISTSKFGVGDEKGSHRTPLGRMRVVTKIGDGYRAGSVFKSRRATGEVLRANAPGRDPIISRILWLKGLEKRNRNAYKRFIYIHGTPEHSRLGEPASYGCIRMGRKDVIDLFNRVGVGTEIYVTAHPLKEHVRKDNLRVR